MTKTKTKSRPRADARVVESRKIALPRATDTAPSDGGNWTCLSNHGHVLVCLARNPDMRLRDVALAVGITERAVQKIVGDLEDGGVLTRERDGRRNRYQMHTERPLRHPLEAHRTIGSLLRMLLTASEQKTLGL
jgi:predicted transcriptional regulator